MVVVAVMVVMVAVMLRHVAVRRQHRQVTVYRPELHVHSGAGRRRDRRGQG